MWGEGGNPRGLLPKKNIEIATQNRLFLNITQQTMLQLGQQHIFNTKTNRAKKLINTYILFHFCAAGKARHQQRSCFQFRTQYSPEDHLVVRQDHVFRLIFQTQVTLHSFSTMKKNKQCWPPLYYYAQSSPVEHIPQQPGQRTDISQPQLEKKFCTSILHCCTVQTKQLDSCHQ